MSPLADSVMTVAQIVLVNAVLSGDNALVIALTSRQLPADLRQRAVLWGSVLAVFLQIACAVLVGRLLAVPGLRLAGAVALVLIARKLIGEARQESQETKPVGSVAGAVLTILVASLAMSLDNVLAVGAISEGVASLIAIGIVVSAVILLGASTLMVALLERHRWITTAGAVLLACTAAGMICDEPLLSSSFGLAATGTHEGAIVGTQLDERVNIMPSETGERPRNTTDAYTAGMAARWTFAIYGMTLSVCFGNPRWSSAIRRFEREREGVVGEEEPAYAQV